MHILRMFKETSCPVTDPPQDAFGKAAASAYEDGEYNKLTNYLAYIIPSLGKHRSRIPSLAFIADCLATKIDYLPQALTAYKAIMRHDTADSPTYQHARDIIVKYEGSSLRTCKTSSCFYSCTVYRYSQSLLSVRAGNLISI